MHGFVSFGHFGCSLHPQHKPLFWGYHGLGKTSGCIFESSNSPVLGLVHWQGFTSMQRHWILIAAQ